MFSMQRSTQAGLGRFGLGTGSLGNLYRAVDDKTAEAVASEAWDYGVRYYDSAPHYGLGLAETRIGRSLAGRPRDEFVFSTKVGRVLEPNPNDAQSPDSEGFLVSAAWKRRWDFSAEGVRRSLADSLARTGLDRVDILYLHDPEEHLSQAIDEALPELIALRSAGVVRAIGVGSKDVVTMTRLVETGEMDLVMVAGRYTLLEQPALAELFPAAVAAGTRVVGVGVFNSGLLATSNPKSSDPYEYGTVPHAMLARARALADVCARHEVELPHAAVQYVLRHPLVVNVTLGIGNPDHVARGARWANEQVPDELWSELEYLGLIPTAAR
jgi:D-threo-aldose 1-dehydrogenase